MILRRVDRPAFPLVPPAPHAFPLVPTARSDGHGPPSRSEIRSGGYSLKWNILCGRHTPAGTPHVIAGDGH
jgi:hypothetical protein